MCTYLTEHVALSGNAKGQHGWFPATTASVYLDHPFEAPFEHALCIDVLDPSSGPGTRVALELDEASALALAQAILSMLEAGRRAMGGEPVAADREPVAADREPVAAARE